MRLPSINFAGPPTVAIALVVVDRAAAARSTPVEPGAEGRPHGQGLLGAGHVGDQVVIRPDQHGVETPPAAPVAAGPGEVGGVALEAEDAVASPEVLLARAASSTGPPRGRAPSRRRWRSGWRSPSRSRDRAPWPGRGGDLRRRRWTSASLLDVLHRHRHLGVGRQGTSPAALQSTTPSEQRSDARRPGGRGPVRARRSRRRSAPAWSRSARGP